MEERPVHLFKPLGSSERACIGRQFALHEVTLVLALVIQPYRLIDHTDYQLKIKQPLTLMPDDFTLNLARRTSGDRRLPTAKGVDAGSPPASEARPTIRRATRTTLTLLPRLQSGHLRGHRPRPGGGQ
ncbi:cytochrome P450 [Streptomyces sp. NPDC001351]|uniref:cytochrome P450 n=1 Tax=Streptomyces sp. NPDC001351 TaxID=3364564 RepID=UPI0036D075D1